MFFEDEKYTSDANVIRILALGDVVGQAGRQALKEHLSLLRKALDIEFVIANGENSAGGIGITPATVKELHSLGVDVITTGNHVWRHKECYGLLNTAQGLIRPGNYHTLAPGRGLCSTTLPGGEIVTVINLAGRVFMDSVACPFETADALLAEIPPENAIIIVDFHAEATSEKRALSHYLDGRVTAIFGTHTHVQTADAMLLPKGTASLTDLGMCGVEKDSVIGMKKESVLQRFITGLPSSFKPATGKASINGALVGVERATGKAKYIRLVSVPRRLGHAG